MKDSPLVSVVMPVFNASATLPDSIESVLAQTYGNLELWVVDDGSSDDSAEVAEGFARRDGRVRVVRLLRSGVVAARNAATDRSRGRFVAFCDSDDLWLPEKLDRQISFMRDTRAAISATGFSRINEAGAAISGPVAMPATIRYSDILSTNSICCASVIYDVQALGKVHMHDYRASRPRLPLYMRVGPPKPLHEDYITWVRILATGTEVKVLQEPLTLYRVRQGSHSGNKLAAAVARWYINANVLMLPFHTNLQVFARYAIRAVWRRGVWRVRAAVGV
jgi:teichuronic acid biosynthesis glycosyltransferase TuaG